METEPHNLNRIVFLQSTSFDRSWFQIGGIVKQQPHFLEVLLDYQSQLFHALAQ